ncbi:MAG TPA: nitroreductase/quinone reductase family protein [Steroidobacteraceae bacterium]|nr:nitroreductase/quinone reductase family protein [Steroidobacteraceae bacterium]
MNLMRWLNRGGHPNRAAMVLNCASARLHALGIAPNYLVTLVVRGRRSGRLISLPLVMAIVDGERYLVAMLGEEVAWVRNVRAADGEVVLRHGRREEVRLQEISLSERAPVIKAFLQRAPGARPHIPVAKDAPLDEFRRIAPRYPVFRVVPR